MTLDQLLDQPFNAWMSGDGPQDDIVLSTRVRLARNIDGMPFPQRADKNILAEIRQLLRPSVIELNNLGDGQYMFIDLEKLPETELNVLVEKHIVSPQHIINSENRALIVREDAAVAIMVNEEDHLRVQCMLPGLNLQKAIELAGKVDDTLQKGQSVAYDEQFGYLTSCPTNVGTGLRASVMLHLPALSLTNQMQRLINAVTQIGLVVRGLYGEGSEAAGHIYQVSNQLTLGQTEQDIVENLQAVVKQVVEQELAARRALLAEEKININDRVWRAYGILRYAGSISGKEALALLSELRMGIDMGLIDNMSPKIFNELVISTRPNFLQKITGKIEGDPIMRDVLRAQVIREKIKNARREE